MTARMGRLQPPIATASCAWEASRLHMWRALRLSTWLSPMSFFLGATTTLIVVMMYIDIDLLTFHHIVQYEYDLSTYL